MFSIEEVAAIRPDSGLIQLDPGTYSIFVGGHAMWLLSIDLPTPGEAAHITRLQVNNLVVMVICNRERTVPGPCRMTKSLPQMTPRMTLRMSFLSRIWLNHRPRCPPSIKPVRSR